MRLPTLPYCSNSNRVTVYARNETRTHDSASPGLPIPPTTARQTLTMTTTVVPSNILTTAPHVPATTNHDSPGCSKDCTINLSVMTSNLHSWSKCMGTAIIGRIHYIVDRANNKTITSTSYAEQVTFSTKGYKVTMPVSDIVGNGSQILTRTDVNAQGTVTYVDGTSTV